ncbi:MAG: hypothetical protein V4567_10835 [Pseudomonadota bacterium]
MSLQEISIGVIPGLREARNPESICCGLQMKIKMDYSPPPRLALRAIGFADVRSGILPPQSGFHRR